MATSIRCAHCGQDVPPPAGPGTRCPACQAVLEMTPGGADARAGTPAFKATDARGGLPIVPIAVGVALVLAIAAYALTRDGPASQAATGLAPHELKVKTIGRPPEPATPPVPEPEPTGPVVTIDLPEDRAPVVRERRKAAEREAQARPARPAPAREAARAEKAAARAGVPAPAPPPAPKVEPDPPLPPPQVVAAPPPEPPTTSPPLALATGPGLEPNQRPRLTSPGCVATALLRRREVDDFAGQSARVRFSVEETGQVSQFSYLAGPSDPRIAAAIWASIQRCEWTAGTNAAGRPVARWVAMPISFGE